MKKKFLAFATVAVLAVSMFGTTAMAAEEGDVIEVTSLSDLAEGEYAVDAALSCISTSSKGVDTDYGTNLVADATLVVDGDGKAELVLETTKNEKESQMGTITNSIGVDGLAYYDGAAYQTITPAATSTHANAFDPENDVTYVTKFAMPVAEVADSYKVAMNIHLGFGYTLFGNGGTNMAGNATTAALNVDWSKVTVVELAAQDTLESGTYKVDISWSPMAGMVQPIVELDADNDTFKVYNESAPENLKGTGSVVFADGVYTMKYEDAKNAGNTTTFTYDAEKDTVTFLTPVYSNGISFNGAGFGVETYTGTLAELAPAAPPADTDKDDAETEDKTPVTDDDEDSKEESKDESKDETTSPSTADPISAGLVAVGIAAAAGVIGTARRKMA